MASDRGRTLPEEGRVCRLLTPCSRFLIMRSNTTGKALASHRTRTSREEGATDTRSRWQARAMEGSGAPGAQDCKDSRRDNAPDSKPGGDNVSAAEKVTRHPLL